MVAYHPHIHTMKMICNIRMTIPKMICKVLPCYILGGGGGGNTTTTGGGGGGGMVTP